MFKSNPCMSCFSAVHQTFIQLSLGILPLNSRSAQLNRFFFSQKITVPTKSYGTRSFSEHLMACGTKPLSSSLTSSQIFLSFSFTTFRVPSGVSSSLEQVSTHTRQSLERAFHLKWTHQIHNKYTWSIILALSSIKLNCRGNNTFSNNCENQKFGKKITKSKVNF